MLVKTVLAYVLLPISFQIVVVNNGKVHNSLVVVCACLFGLAIHMAAVRRPLASFISSQNGSGEPIVLAARQPQRVSCVLFWKSSVEDYLVRR
jgi:hypothetical protein